MKFILPFLLLITCTVAIGMDFDPAVQDGPVDTVSEKVFGISVRNYDVHGGIIRRNENLSDILSDCDVEYAKIHKLSQRSKAVFDVRNLKAGRPYTILSTNDSEARTDYMIYEANPEEYILFDLRGDISVERKSKEIERVLTTAVGIINGSLYGTLEANNLSPRLAIELSEVYAWTVDFFKLNKGDRFKIIYEEKFADGEYIGVGEIKAASFVSNGETFNAYYFDGMEIPEFFNEEGESLRRAFLRAPVKFSRISSRYSKRRFHPVQKRFKAHLGTDYAAPKGTPILATADGVVEAAGYKKYNGNYVKVRHNGTYTTQYLHMSKIKAKRGERVKQGDVIGYVGMTGLATGNHVCYRFWKNGVQVDPYRQKLPEAEPLAAEKMPAFLKVVAQYQETLDGLEYPDQGMLSFARR